GQKQGFFVSRVQPDTRTLPALPSSIGGTSPRSGRIVVEQRADAGPVVQLQAYAGQVNETFKRLTAAQQAQLRTVQAKANSKIAEVRGSQLSTLLTRSGVALAIMALASIGLGWLIAGRALRPMR